MCRAIQRVGGGIALALVWACQSPPLVDSADGFRHTRQGWSIDAPRSAGAVGRWERVRVQGSLLGYRLGGSGAGVWMTLSSRCKVSLAEPRLLARHLRIGIPESTVREAGAVEVGGVPGWQQRFDAVADGVAVVQLKTVTAVVGGCALDWVLSVGESGAFGAAERDFDAWWQSFRPAPAPGAPAEAS